MWSVSRKCAGGDRELEASFDVVAPTIPKLRPQPLDVGTEAFAPFLGSCSEVEKQVVAKPRDQESRERTLTTAFEWWHVPCPVSVRSWSTTIPGRPPSHHPRPRSVLALNSLD